MTVFVGLWAWQHESTNLLCAYVTSIYTINIAFIVNENLTFIRTDAQSERQTTWLAIQIENFVETLLLPATNFSADLETIVMVIYVQEGSLGKNLKWTLYYEKESFGSWTTNKTNT